MPANAMMMIHNAWTFAMGFAADLRKIADDLDKIQTSMVPVYAQKSGLPDEKIIELLDAETWMTADEAKEYGFADEIEEGKQVAASLNAGILTINGQQIDLKTYKNPPKLVFLPRNGPDTQEQDAKPDADRLFLLGKQLETKKKKFNISEVEKA
jgi:ATP-dependent Clp protease protease subunit